MNYYQTTTKEEHFAVMSTMAEYLSSQDEPKVGIFWYDEIKDELFGVSKVNSIDIKFNINGLKTISTLHKTWWQKEKNRALSKRDSGLSVLFSCRLFITESLIPPVLLRLNLRR